MAALQNYENIPKHNQKTSIFFTNEFVHELI